MSSRAGGEGLLFAAPPVEVLAVGKHRVPVGGREVVYFLIGCLLLYSVSLANVLHESIS